MINAYHHIELGDLQFRLAEAAEGKHYVLRGEPLRPPGAQVVQGENNVFTTRDEVLLWSITDWSGGEGQIKFNPDQRNRHWRLHNVDAFLLPGKVMPAPAEDEATDTSDVALGVPLWPIGTDSSGVLWGAKITQPGTLQGWEMYYNAGAGWVASGDYTGSGSSLEPVFHGACIVGDLIFLVVERDVPATTNLYYYDTVAGTISTWNTDIAAAVANDGAVRRLGAVGDYVYVAVDGKTYEVAASGTPPIASTVIDDAQDKLAGMLIIDVVSSSNRVYTVWTSDTETVVREIIPTTAAGTGYAQPFGRWGGFKAQSAWVQGETLFMSGQLNGEPVILYVATGDRTYGSIGKVQQTADGIPEDTPRYLQVGSTQYSFLETFGFLGYEGTVVEGGVETFTTSDTWTVPTGVTSVKIEAWGGGGGGGGAGARRIGFPGGAPASIGGGGGGGGAYEYRTYTVAAGQVLTLTVGGGGAGGAAAADATDYGEDGANGGTTTVSHSVDGTILTAAGGIRGRGGGASSSDVPGRGGAGAVPVTPYSGAGSGGNGGDGGLTYVTSEDAGGGGGGGSAFGVTGIGATNDGNDGEDGNHGAPTTFPRAEGGAGEGHGAGGRVTTLGSQNAGVPGGGGGGGAADASGLVWSTGIAGGKGQVRISWGSSILDPEGTGEVGIYVIDQTSGGLAQWATAQDTNGLRANPYQYGGRVFYYHPDGLRMVRGRDESLWTETGAYVVSPLFNFGIHEEKVLSALTLYTDPLPADWQLALSYRTSLGDAWTQVGTYGEEDGQGTTLAVTSSSTLRTFRELQVKAEFQYTGTAGTETDRPALLGIDVEATVVRQFRTWELLLDLADEGQRQSPRTGSSKMADLLNLYSAGGSISFKDGYKDRAPNEYTTHSVFIDALELDAERPGEGVARILLREAAG